MSTVETVPTNALLVLPDAVVPGTAVLRGGLSAEAQPVRSGLSSAEDLAGATWFPAWWTCTRTIWSRRSGARASAWRDRRARPRCARRGLLGARPR